MGGCVGGWMDGGVDLCGLCEITKNLINFDLIEIIQFWLMDGSFF